MRSSALSAAPTPSAAKAHGIEPSNTNTTDAMRLISISFAVPAFSIYGYARASDTEDGVREIPACFPCFGEVLSGFPGPGVELAAVPFHLAAQRQGVVDIRVEQGSQPLNDGRFLLLEMHHQVR